jgi:hypothetical protein
MLYHSLMPIDGCKHSFEKLANDVLPDHMRRMKLAMRQAIPMRTFAYARAAECRARLGQATDFSGCYVLMSGRKPIYAGISRAVIARLRQHVKGNTHFDASLAYRMAKQRAPHELHRGKAMLNKTFRGEFENARGRLRRMRVAAIRIDCPVELYAFELYCSMKLDTAKWNTFRTH